MLGRIVDGCDRERRSSKRSSAIGISDDVVEGDFTVEVGIGGEGVVAFSVIRQSAVVGRDASNRQRVVVVIDIGEAVQQLRCSELNGVVLIGASDTACRGSGVKGSVVNSKDLEGIADLRPFAAV